GGSAADQAYAVAVDSAGAAYVVGQTYAGNIPETFSISQSTGNQNAFIVKLNAAGNFAALQKLPGSFASNLPVP
ncbi:MAG TPA: SBBP repeat-containing protein, partial [Candidatus Sulfotelmatobacter sp.]